MNSTIGSFLVPSEYFSEQQITIIDWKLHDKSIRVIQRLFEEKYCKPISLEAVETCLLRSAKALPWEKTGIRGADPYLCQYDLDQLEEIVFVRANDRHHLSPDEVTQEALQLKQKRRRCAINFLASVKCYTLSKKMLDEQPTQPSRPWVNTLTDKIEVNIKNSTLIDENRILCCNRTVISDFFNSYQKYINSFNPNLLFTADETMLSAIHSSKVVVPPLKCQSCLR